MSNRTRLEASKCVQCALLVVHDLGGLFSIPLIQELGCRDFYADAFTSLCRDLPADPRTLLGSVDIRETDKDFQFVVDVPGLTKEDIKVRVSGDGILTIEGERKVCALSCFTT